MKSTKMIGIMMLVGLTALVVTPAIAESVERFEVPFEFVVADQVLPAGQYKAVVSPTLGRLELRMVGGDIGAFLTAIPVQLSSTAEAGKLIFHEYGDVRVLRGMSIRGGALGVELPPCKTERELARLASGTTSVRASAKLSVDKVQAR
jgi:hypothetical protein